ncbi:hypothetical protein EVAR_52267_1 [Eumeta japonica]|uniref:Uncharacterized protein n=1 Tax=Eumeta variegata TaxID=151549 RepID=A0A4C1YU81_EUMVA|nr:hypothetical protein EVAR_52267_1 [Eumeta japonica]
MNEFWSWAGFREEGRHVGGGRGCAHREWCCSISSKPLRSNIIEIRNTSDWREHSTRKWAGEEGMRAVVGVGGRRTRGGDGPAIGDTSYNCRVDLTLPASNAASLQALPPPLTFCLHISR